MKKRYTLDQFLRLLPLRLRRILPKPPFDPCRFNATVAPERYARVWAVWYLFPMFSTTEMAFLVGEQVDHLRRLARRLKFADKKIIPHDFCLKALRKKKIHPKSRQVILDDNLTLQSTPKQLPAPADKPKKPRDVGIDYLLRRVREQIDVAISNADPSQLSALLSSLTRAAESTRGRASETGRTLTEVCQEIAARRTIQLMKRKKRLQKLIDKIRQKGEIEPNEETGQIVEYTIVQQEQPVQEEQKQSIQQDQVTEDNKTDF